MSIHGYLSLTFPMIFIFCFLLIVMLFITLPKKLIINRENNIVVTNLT